MMNSTKHWFPVGLFTVLSICVLLLSTSAFSNENDNRRENRAETTLNTDEIAKNLQMLAQYEIDSTFILGQSIEALKNKIYRTKLLSFRQECETHIKELAEMIHKYGREAPDYTRDFKGFFMQGYVAIRGLTGDTSILKALHTNLKLVKNSYESALKLNLPADVKAWVKRGADSKKKQIQYLETEIGTKRKESVQDKNTPKANDQKENKKDKLTTYNAY